MSEEERCAICSYRISKNMVVCPNCGNVIHRNDFHIITSNRYNFNIDKNLEYLEKMDDALSHLEEELDAILCQKR
ncbi:MAG: hypothetical protein JXR64_08125 [Spirochaetales bacterium]|nr:hypothetical protein [Spirochaetales bacterium]